MSIQRHRQSGFSLLEAIVAMTIMATSLLALYAWLSSSTFALSRAQAQTAALEDARAALALVDAVNPMEEPSGKRSVAGLDIIWSSTAMVPPAPGRTRIGAPGAFDIALYTMDVEIRRKDSTIKAFSVRRAGWKLVRPLGDEEE